MENVHMQILDQIGINRKNTCFITLRDHKANFLKNSAVWLINPAKLEKLELGRISHAILHNIKKHLCTNLNIY